MLTRVDARWRASSNMHNGHHIAKCPNMAALTRVEARQHVATRRNAMRSVWLSHRDHFSLRLVPCTTYGFIVYCIASCCIVLYNNTDRIVNRSIRQSWTEMLSSDVWKRRSSTMWSWGHPVLYSKPGSNNWKSLVAESTVGAWNNVVG